MSTPNADIRTLEDKIIEDLNSSNLIIEIKRLIVKDVLGMIERTADNTIRSELNEEVNDVISEN